MKSLKRHCANANSQNHLLKLYEQVEMVKMEVRAIGDVMKVLTHR